MTIDSNVLIGIAIAAYLLGSVPFGLVITRALGLGDLRRIGSGNIGATNVLRTGNKGAAAATLLLDGGKGALAVLVARHFYGEDAGQLAGLMAFIGHLYPVWLRFKGGKGVATFLGVMLALSWQVGLAICASWLVTAVVTRISSVAALVSAASSGLWAFLFGQYQVFVICFILTIFIYARHWENLGRIKKGTEPKIGQKKPQEPEATT